MIVKNSGKICKVVLKSLKLSQFYCCRPLNLLLLKQLILNVSLTEKLHVMQKARLGEYEFATFMLQLKMITLFRDIN